MARSIPPLPWLVVPEARLQTQSEAHLEERRLLEAGLEAAQGQAESLERRLTQEAQALDQRIAVAQQGEAEARAARAQCEEALREAHATSHVAAAEHALAVQEPPNHEPQAQPEPEPCLTVQELRLAADSKEGELQLWRSKAECAEEKEAWLRARLDERDEEARRDLAAKDRAHSDSIAAQMEVERGRWEQDRLAAEEAMKLEQAAMRREVEAAQTALATVEAEFRSALVENEVRATRHPYGATPDL